jgi:hypothetical protein
MIKATGSDEDGEPVLLLGLSYKNLKRLQADEPIMFDGSPYGYPGKIMIFAGPTEAAMARMIENNNPGVVKLVEPDAP